MWSVRIFGHWAAETTVTTDLQDSTHFMHTCNQGRINLTDRYPSARRRVLTQIQVNAWARLVRYIFDFDVAIWKVDYSRHFQSVVAIDVKL